MKLTSILKLLMASIVIKKLSAGQGCGDTGAPIHLDRHKLQNQCVNAIFTYNSCSHCCGYHFIDNGEISTAVDIFQSDNATAVQKNGVMNC